MSHPLAIIGTTVSGSPRSDAAPLAHVPIPTGGAIVPHRDYHSVCEPCPLRDTHRAFEPRVWLEGRDSDIPEAERIITTDAMARLQFLLSYLYFCSESLATRGFIYGSGDDNTFVHFLASWRVAGVAGNVITFHTDGVSPWELAFNTHIVNPDWPAPDTPRLLQTTFGTSLQIGDLGIIENSIYSGRLDVRVMRINGPSSGSTFQVTADKALPSILTALDEGSPVRVSFWGYRYSPEPWLEPVRLDTLKAIKTVFEIESGDFPASGEILLCNDIIAFPRIDAPAPFRRTIDVIAFNDGGGWQDLTEQCVNQGRFSVAHTAANAYQTKIHLGESLPNGSTGENLLFGRSRVSITYWRRDALNPSTHGWAMERPRCIHDKEVFAGVEALGNCPGVSTDGASASYCARRFTASGAKTHQRRCAKLGTCNEFQQFRPQHFTREFLNQLWTGGVIRLVQNQVGVAGHRAFRIDRVGAPNIVALLGHWKNLSTPGGRHPIVLWLNGLYGFLDNNYFIRGAFYRNPDTGLPSDPMQTLTRTAPAPATVHGALPSRVAGWTSKPRLSDMQLDENDTSDPFRIARVYPYPRHQGYSVQGDSGQRVGVFDSARKTWQNRFADQVLAPALRLNQRRQTGRQVTEFGKWDAQFNPTSGDAPAFTARTIINTARDNWTEAAKGVKVSGKIKSLVNNGDGTFTIECHLGTDSAASIVGVEELETTWAAGGNIVYAGEPWMINNHAGPRPYGNPHDKAMPADVLTVEHPVYGEIRFPILRVEAHAGTPPASGTIPVDQNDKRRIRYTGSLYETAFTDADEMPVRWLKRVAGSGGAFMRRVAMAQSPVYNTLMKFYIEDYAGGVWTNASNAADTIAVGDFEDLGRPPGAWSGAEASNYRVNNGEYYVFLSYNPATESTKWSVGFSAAESEAMFDITYNDTTSESAVSMPAPNMLISDELFAAINAIPAGASVGPKGETLKIWLDQNEGGTAGGSLVALSRTANASAATWWGSGQAPTTRNLFFTDNFGGVGPAYLRLHADYAARQGEALIPATKTYTPAEADQHFIDRVAIHGASIPPDYENFVAKPDKLRAQDQAGILAAIAASLTDTNFSVYGGGFLNLTGAAWCESFQEVAPWNSIAAVSYAVLGGNWTIYWRAEFITALLGAGQIRSLKLDVETGYRGNDVDARMINDTVQATLHIDTAETGGWGLPFPSHVFLEEYYGKNARHSSDACGGCRSSVGRVVAVFEWGGVLTEENITVNLPCGGQETFTDILEVDPAEATIFGESFSFSFAQDFDNIGPNGIPVREVSFSPSSLLGGNLYLIKNMSDNCQIVKAIVYITINGGAWTRTRKWNALTDASSHFGGWTDYVDGPNVVDGQFNLSAYRFDKDGAFQSIATVGPFVAPADGVKSEPLDITDLIVAIYGDRNSGARGYSIVLTPATEAVTANTRNGLPEPHVWEQYHFYMSCPPGTGEWLPAGESEAMFEAVNWLYDVYIWNFNATGILFSPVYVKFTLPASLTVDGAPMTWGVVPQLKALP